MAPRRLVNAATGSSKNITPNRLSSEVEPVGSGSACASQTSNATLVTPSRSARRRAASIIGPEMSMPVGTPPGARRAAAIVVAPVPHPTSSTVASGAGTGGVEERRRERGEHLVVAGLRRVTQIAPSSEFQYSALAGVGRARSRAGPVAVGLGGRHHEAGLRSPSGGPQVLVHVRHVEQVLLVGELAVAGVERGSSTRTGGSACRRRPGGVIWVHFTTTWSPSIAANSTGNVQSSSPRIDSSRNSRSAAMPSTRPQAGSM